MKRKVAAQRMMASEVRRVLTARNLSIEWLAVQIGRQPGYLSRVLSGNAGGSWVLIDDIATALGLVWSVTLEVEPRRHAGLHDQGQVRADRQDPQDGAEGRGGAGTDR